LERLLPFFGNDKDQLEQEVEIIVMKKGKMRGQGFMNFKSVDKAMEVFDAFNGIVLGNKAISLEFSQNKRLKVT
jgi:RNA recognition motif-containing protein